MDQTSSLSSSRFHEWPEAALQSVAHHFLGKAGMPEEVLQGRACVEWSAEELVVESVEFSGFFWDCLFYFWFLASFEMAEICLNGAEYV